ncbi:hypothetical protein DFH08DRAFT_799420 [Mycena albidolilacea]|uniref:Uncharacterized protein n=1 Tax=Mycena albidolilacea TaxID=1033008 RepID=A0AAD7F1Y0_9AGAR|nr:hypothetical protein DFH08DRAFT_799420 [Mycena albidolilacea]
MWVERRVEDAVERKVRTEGMEDGGEGLHTAGMEMGGRGGRRCGMRGGSERGAAGRIGEGDARQLQRSGEGERTERRWMRSGSACRETAWRGRGMRRDGIAARRGGGEVVRAQQQGRVGLQEKNADIVWSWSTRRRVRKAGAEVEAGLGRGANEERDGRAHTQAGAQRRAVEAGRNGLGNAQEGGAAAQ